MHNSGGYNVQNFKRGGTLRKAINAGKDADGNDLYCYVADLSGIELRVAIALTNDVQRIELLRANEDLYCHTATGLFGEVVVKEGQPGYAEDPMKQRRLVGKVADLSLQYGAGKIAFQGMLRTMGKLMWDADQCQNVVDNWRVTHPDTVRRWDQLNQAVRSMMRGGTPPDWPLVTAENRPVFSFESDGILLPRGLRIKYPNLRMVEEEITIGNEIKLRKHMAYDDARTGQGYAKLYGGKVFENLCVHGETLTVTDQGTKPLKAVTASDKVWDGVEWVSHEGLVHKGRKSVIERFGIWMTPDHRVLTDAGWMEAQDVTCEHAARYELPPGVCGVSLDARSLQPKDTSSVGELRSAWHLRMRTVARQFLKFLGRYGTYLQTRTIPRTSRQRRELLPEKLSVGYLPRSEQQPPQQRDADRPRDGRAHTHSRPLREVQFEEDNAVVQDQTRSTAEGEGGLSSGASAYGSDAARYDASSRGVASVRCSAFHTTPSAQARLGRGGSVRVEAEVYDLLNCGPRTRFTVLDAQGRPVVVHNCQALATCIYMEQVRKINRLHPVKLSVHDEVVLVGSYDKLKTLAPFIEKIMRTPPDWWPNLPLEVEGDIAHRYGDAK